MKSKRERYELYLELKKEFEGHKYEIKFNFQKVDKGFRIFLIVYTIIWFLFGVFLTIAAIQMN